jgi:hypothetical protein
MLDQEAINQKQQALIVHRRRLEHLFQQYITLGAYTPPYVAIDIEQTQAVIREIKAQLRASSVVVDEHPDDERTVQVASPPSSVLHQLRAPVSDFVGRKQEIDKLIRALSKANGGAAAISGVRGMGGIGKTELAYVIANRLKDIYPDAQIVVELRGASSSPLSPEQSLQMVIRAFDRKAELPNDLGQLQSIYRGKLSGKRALILADDAHGIGQIRPLMPPAGCALLVTTRNRFSLPGMQTLDLEVLSPTDAEALLLEICPRIDQLAQELAKLCGYLPLALRASAGLLRENDSRNVVRYLEQLQAERLKHLNDPDNPDDTQASVEASLRVSYDELEVITQSTLCQLSVFPASFDADAAKAVVVIAGEVVKVLEQLRRRSLLQWEAVVHRYSLHDLVRAFAAMHLEDADAVKRRHAWYYARLISRAQYDLKQRASGRFTVAWLCIYREYTNLAVGWNWALGHVGDPDADALLVEYPVDAPAEVYGVYGMRSRGFGSEQVKGHANELNTDVLLVDCPDTLYAIADRRYYEKSLEHVRHLEVKRAAAQRIGRRSVEEYFLCLLGVAHAILGDVCTAIDYYELALAIAQEIGDQRGESWVLETLKTSYAKLGGVREVYGQYLLMARERGDEQAEASANWKLGLVLEKQGEFLESVK